jgi:hypothetical protein
VQLANPFNRKVMVEWKGNKVKRSRIGRSNG